MAATGDENQNLIDAFYTGTPNSNLPPNVASRRAAATSTTNAATSTTNAATSTTNAAANLSENITAIKNAMKNKFAGKTRHQKAELLKEILNAVAAGPFISGLTTEAKFQATKPPGDRAKRIAAFMDKEEEIELFGGRRRKSRKASRKSRKSQRKSRKASRK